MPLWKDGLLLADADEGVRLFGLSQKLALALEDWGTGWDGRRDHAQRDAEAETLLARLRSELGDRFEFRYHRQQRRPDLPRSGLGPCLGHATAPAGWCYGEVRGGVIVGVGVGCRVGSGRPR